MAHPVQLQTVERTSDDDSKVVLCGGSGSWNGHGVEDSKWRTGCRSDEHSHVTHGSGVVHIKAGQMLFSDVHQTRTTHCGVCQTVHHLTQQSDDETSSDSL